MPTDHLGPSCHIAARVRSRRVSSEGNWQLDDPSDLGATRFLNALLKVYEQALSSEDTG